MTLSTPERNILRALVVLNIAAGIVFLPAGVYYTWRSLGTSHTWTDFTPYYWAAHLAAHAPERLYQLSAYLDFYSTIKGGSLPHHWLGYMATPFIAVLLIPVSLLSYSQAYLVFTALNLCACLGIARIFGLLADTLGMEGALKVFLQSVVFFLMITGAVFIKGQLSLFYCLCFATFLLAITRQKMTLAALCLAFLLQMRPPLFLPLLLFAAGCRQWRLVVLTAAVACASVAATLPVVGIHAWLDYVHQLSQFNNATLPESAYYFPLMISLRGMFSGFEDSLLASLIFALFSTACFLWPWRKKRAFTLQSAALLMPFALLFSPYVQMHDCLLLLPACVILTAMLAERAHAKWMMLPYILGSYLSLPLPVYCLRLLLVALCGLSGYLAIDERAKNL